MTPTAAPSPGQPDSTAARAHRRSRLAGPFALAAVAATILLSGLAITVLATAELRVRAAVAAQRALDEAVQESAACAGAFASQTAAWKSYLLAESWNDERASSRAKSALATASSELHERLARLEELGTQSGLPVDAATRAARTASSATEQLVEAIADTRGSDEASLIAADRATLPAIEQVRHELFTLHSDWSRSASELRVEATSAAAETARRIKAWIEILSLLTVILVVTVGALAVRKDASHGGA
ncbi:MAG: hypothetical protein RL354_448 [Planctomycetota bacterium]